MTKSDSKCHRPKFPTREEVQFARDADLLAYIQSCGHALKKSGTNEYCLVEHDSLKISNNRWCWHSQNRIGGSCIDFAMHFPVPNQYDFKEAVLMVLDQLNMSIENKPVHSQKIQSTPKQEKPQHVALELPHAYENNHRVIAYLTKTRMIDRQIILELIDQGKLYECKDRHNCVFLGYDKEGTIRYAFNRGTLTYARFAGDSIGSNKDFGFVVEGKSDRLFVFESPIDALSHATLTKLHGHDYNSDTRLSLGCVSEGALKQYLEGHQKIQEIILCLDNDKAGIENAERIKALYQDSHYKMSIEKPNAKDFNEDLVIFMTKNRQKVLR
jgi:hypothetical protein